MAWSKRALESVTENRLKELLGDVPGEERFARYLIARRKLVEEILPEIRVSLPECTDHDQEHVGRVMDNATKLIGLENEDSDVNLNGVELYCLLLSVLFHDVGNVFGREEHQHKVAKVYDYVFPDSQRDIAERRVVVAMTAAHCGDAADGSKDTLRELIGTFQLERRQVRVCEIAAVLRFADELEEGPERTSLYMQKYHRYPAESELHHRYARMIDPCIDRGNMRIALTFYINIDTGGTRRLSLDRERKLRELLEYTYKRISKLNQERKYSKFYCDSLLPFKETTVAFDFLVDDLPFTFGLPPSVVLNDLVVPGEDTEKKFVDYSPGFKTDNVIEVIRKKLEASTVK